PISSIPRRRRWRSARASKWCSKRWRTAWRCRSSASAAEKNRAPAGRGFCLGASASVFDEAIHVVALGAVRAGVLGQAVDVRLETGEALVELAGELQVLHDGAVEAFARNQQRDAGRIRREQHAGDPAFELVDLDPLDLAVRHAGE